LDTSFFLPKIEKNHSHGVKESWNYSGGMHDYRMAGSRYGLLACADRLKGEEKETVYL
jgi:hypothetical protein